MATAPLGKGNAASGQGKVRQAAVGLGLALAIVVAAWWVGGRAGFGEIGQGGINRRFLPEVGEVAPDVMALDSTARGVWLSDYRGKPVWLTFWGSWCPPCRSEMPEIQAAYEQLAPQGVVLMAVSVDEPFEVAQAFAAANGATFSVLNVPNRALIADRYDVYNYPTHLFIDADGVVRKIIAGPVDEATALAAAQTILSPTAAGIPGVETAQRAPG